jgi:hypothetical protein
MVLPFGLSSAPYVFTKLTRPLVAKWRCEGKRVIMFLDDGLGSGDGKVNTQKMSDQIKHDILQSGFIPKADKSFWVPVQILEWLGAILNSVQFSVCIPQRRLDKVAYTLQEIKAQKRVLVRKLASFIGQIISMSIVIGPVSQIMTRFLSMDVLKAQTWNSYVSISHESFEQLCFWETNMAVLSHRKLNTAGVCSKIVYSDASSTAFAAYEVNTINGVSHGVWSTDEACRSSTWRELCAVYRSLIALKSVLKDQRVKWFTDNTGVCSIVEKGSMKIDLQTLAMHIFSFCCQNSIHLEIEWIPREMNDRADYLSRVIEKDDWGISFEVMDVIQQHWGVLDVDYFASEHNAKLSVFYSRFWCAGSAGVDAFTYDWGESFGLYVPPICLVTRVLCKMRNCRSRGVLVIPQWRSANFWPLLCTDCGLFKSFIIDWLYLPTEKGCYTPCRNGVGMFGNEDLKFPMLALYIDFSHGK